MNIEKIPGYEKTPDEIKIVKDALEIHKIAGIKTRAMDDNLFENAAVIKKLLDDRRLLLYHLLFHHICIDAINPYTDKQLKEVDRLFKKVTGRTFHEVLKVIND